MEFVHEVSPVRDGEPHKVRLGVLSAKIDIQARAGAIRIEDLVTLLRSFIAGFGEDYRLDFVGLDPIQVPIHDDPRLGP